MLFLLFACGLLRAETARVLAWDITSQTAFFQSLSTPPVVEGAQFSISSTQTVLALGMFGSVNTPIFAHTVQLWTDGGTLLASAIVNKTTSTPVVSLSPPNRWLFTDITPLTLDPGTYRIGVGYGVLLPGLSDDFTGISISVTSIGASYITMANSNGGAGTTAFPSILSSNAPLFGPNLQFEASPEPRSSAMLLLGLGAVVLASTRRRRAPALPTSN